MSEKPHAVIMEVDVMVGGETIWSKPFVFCNKPSKVPTPQQIAGEMELDQPPYDSLVQGAIRAIEHGTWAMSSRTDDQGQVWCHEFSLCRVELVTIYIRARDGVIA